MWECHFISACECAIVRLTQHWANGENWRVVYGMWAQHSINVNFAIRMCVLSVCERTKFAEAKEWSERCVLWVRAWNDPSHETLIM